MPSGGTRERGWCREGHSKDCVDLPFHMSNDLLMGGQREWIICSAPLCVGAAREKEDGEDVGRGLSLWDTWLMPLFVQFLGDFEAHLIESFLAFTCLFVCSASAPSDWWIDLQYERIWTKWGTAVTEREQCTLPLSLVRQRRRGVRGRKT